MKRRPPSSTRTDTLVPYTTLCRYSRKAQYTEQAGARFQIDPHGLCHYQGIRRHASHAQRTGSPLVPAARHQGRGAPCGESFWHWALGADGGHGHAQPPFRSSRLIGAERQPTSDCRQSLQQSPPAKGARICFWVMRASRSEEQTSEIQSLMRISYAVFC